MIPALRRHPAIMISRLRHVLRPGNEHRAAAMKGASWTTIGFVTSNVIRLGSTLILTRLLTPDVFGLMSLTMVFVSGLTMLSDVGTVPSIIRSPRGDDPDFLRTAWSIQAVRGFMIAGILLLIAWPVSVFYDKPVMVPLLCVLALGPIAQGLTSISLAHCQRKLDLARLTVLDIGSQVATTLATVAFAWWNGSVWALVCGSLFGVILKVVLSYLWLPAWKPRLMFEHDAMQEIVRFGRWILIGTFFTFMGGEGTKLVMGKLVSLETLGLIGIATTIAWAFGDLVQRILGQVAFPAMSRVYRERPEALPDMVGKLKKMILVFVLPAFLIVALFSQRIIDLLYDPRYTQAGGFMLFFALNNAIGTLAMPYQNALLVIGNSRAHSMIMGSSAVMRIAFLIIGAHFYGAYGLIAGFGAASFLSYLMAFWFARKAGMSGWQYDLISLILILGFYIYGWQVVTAG